MENQQEIWKDIKGYEGHYQISNLGRVKSLKNYRGNGDIILKEINRLGYLHVSLCREGKIINYKIHRLVCMAFLDNKENKPCVNHINGEKTDNRLVNLEWVTYSENEKHSYRVLNKVYASPMKGKYGQLIHNSKLVIQISLDGFIVNVYDSQATAERETGIRQQSISRCVSGIRYKTGGYIWK